MKENSRIKEKTRMGNLSVHDHHPHHIREEDSQSNSPIATKYPTQASNEESI